MVTIKKQIYQFLSFNLTGEMQAMLPTEQLSEILTIEPNQIVPIFDLPSPIMGVYNHRGEVLWIIDLAYFLDLEPLFSQPYRSPYSVLILHQGNKVIGLVIGQVGQLVLYSEAQIQSMPASHLPPKLSFCFKGEKRNPDGKKILVLDGEKIFELLSQSET